MSKGVVVMTTLHNPFGRTLILALCKQKISISSVVVEEGTQLQKNCVNYLANDFDMPPEFDDLVKEYGLHVTKVPHHNKAECEKVLDELNPEFILLGGTRVLKPHILRDRKILNAHPGLLPYYQGLDPVLWAISNDVPVGGTCHLVNEGIDSGPILLREGLDYSDCKTLIEVRVKAMQLCVKLLIEAYERFDSIEQVENVGGVRHMGYPAEKIAELDAKIVNPKLKSVIIGCGNIAFGLADFKPGFASTHFEGYRDNDDVQLVGVCDLSQEVVKSVAHKHEIKFAFTSVKEMMRALKPDLVSICVPDPFHFPVFKEILGWGVKGIWMEKPIAVSVEEGEEIASLAKKENVKIVVNYIRRYDPFFQDVKKRVEELIGDIENIVCYHTGGLSTNGSHAVDILRFFLGDCKEVLSKEIDSRHWAALDFPESRAQIIPCKGDGYSLLEWDILGSKGRLNIMNLLFGNYNYIYFPVEKGKISGVLGGKMSKPLQEDFPRSFIHNALKDLVALVKNEKKDAICGIEEGLKSLELIGAIAYSAEHGKKVSLPFSEKSYVIPKPEGDIKKWKK